MQFIITTKNPVGTGNHKHLDKKVLSSVNYSAHGLPKDWKHPRQRLRSTWLCTIDTDLQPFAVESRGFHQNAQKRSHCLSVNAEFVSVG